MKKEVIYFGEFLDILMFFGLSSFGLYQLYSGNILAGCALLCTTVVWQRFWNPNYIIHASALGLAPYIKNKEEQKAE